LSVIELDDVQVEYLRRDGVVLRAVAGATLRVEAGEIVGLVGETGLWQIVFGSGSGGSGGRQQRRGPL